MYSTAGLQVCLDAGRAGPGCRPAGRRCTRSGRRCWPRSPPPTGTPGGDTGWASARMAAWFGIDPARTRPVWTPDGRRGPGRRPGPGTRSPRRCSACAATARTGRRRPGVTFADWIDGALPRPPTADDLDYHLSTLFPPVRPRGYLEVRYLDTQPGRDWLAPAGGARRAARRPGHGPRRPATSPRRWPHRWARRRPARPGRPGAGRAPRRRCSTWPSAGPAPARPAAGPARRHRPRRPAATRRRGEETPVTDRPRTGGTGAAAQPDRGGAGPHPAPAPPCSPTRSTTPT